MLEKVKQFFLFFILGLIIFSIYNRHINNSNIVPTIPNIVIPNVPDTTKTIFYDEYEEAKKVSIAFNKKLLIIFGADWCPYCKDLKKDVSRIENFTYYIVCFINTDKNKDIVSEFKIKSLPTSIIVDKENEEVRKTGYKYRDYEKWLEENHKHTEISWTKF